VRFAVTALLLGLWLLRQGELPRRSDITHRDAALLVLAAAGLAANYVFSVKALNEVTPAECSVLSLMNGVLLLGCGVLFLRERLSRIQVAGLVVFLIGQGLFLLPRLAGSAFDARFALGALLLAAASGARGAPSTHLLLEEFLPARRGGFEVRLRPRPAGGIGSSNGQDDGKGHGETKVET
jgi:drug/metabolite transporter (DMT)-like permease